MRRNMQPASKIKKGTFGRVLKYIFKSYPVHIVVVIVCIVFNSLAATIATVFMQRLIDEAIIPGMQTGLESVIDKIISIIGTMALFYLAGTVGGWLYTRLMAIVTQGTLKNFRDDMYSKMETLPIRYFDTHLSGDIMSTYTNDTDAIRQMIGQSIPSLIQSAVSIVSIMIMMLNYSIWLTIVVVVMIYFMILVTKKFGGESSEYMRRQQQSLAAVEGYIEEQMNGQKVVKVFNHEAAGEKAFDEINELLYEDCKKANTAGNVLMPILLNMGNILYVLVAIVGGFLVFSGATNFSLQGASAITIGVIVSFLGMSRQLSQTVSQISMQTAMIAMGMAGASRVFELMDEEPEHDEGVVELVNANISADGVITESEKKCDTWAWKLVDKDGNASYRPLEGKIEMDHVDFGYNEDRQILYDITLYAKPGQKIAFVGSTGAGKTTITNLINRFYDIQDGKIRYDGIDITKIKKGELRRSLGIVLQDVNLFTGTVMDNIRYGRLDATDEECIEAAKLANADDFITRLPDGYDTMLTGNGSQLSQGQRQLITIARAAVADPPVMIMDEATSSIDTRTESLVQKGMDNLMKGRTVFVIAHRLSTVQNSDAIMVLEHGHIIERGTHEQLVEQKGTYYQLYTGAFELE